LDTNDGDDMADKREFGLAFLMLAMMSLVSFMA
jgi:hypothetical protein